MKTLELIKELTQIPGISGYERDFADYVCQLIRPLCPDAQVTRMGSVIGTYGKFDPNKKTILFEAHLDRIGLVVSEILSGGFLRFKPLGGVDERILPASEVYIMGKKNKVFGIIGALPPHLQEKGASDETDKIENMLIDTGLDDETLKQMVSVGDPILLQSEFLQLLGNRLSSAALDNRAGMTAVIAALNSLSGKALSYNIRVAFTTGEELGLHGAKTLLDGALPDLAVVVDVTHGHSPDAKKTDTFSLGCGTIICRGPNLHYDITNKVLNLAKTKEIPYEIEVAAGCTGTNAWVIQTAGSGVPCVLLSIPLRYMHTTVETIDLKDVEHTASLLCELACGGDILA